jgi:hypothetical protein
MGNLMKRLPQNPVRIVCSDKSTIMLFQDDNSPRAIQKALLKHRCTGALAPHDD